MYRYLIRPSSLSPRASPLIDERRMFTMKRQEPTGAEKAKDSGPTMANAEVGIKPYLIDVLHLLIRTVANLPSIFR